MVIVVVVVSLVTNMVMITASIEVLAARTMILVIEMAIVVTDYYSVVVVLSLVTKMVMITASIKVMAAWTMILEFEMVIGVTDYY